MIDNINILLSMICLGFPNMPIAQKHRDFLHEAFVIKDLNQYTRSMGHPRLVNALSDFFSPLIFGEQSNTKLDPMTDIIVTNGACEALYLTAMSFLDPGDEVIIIEPFYDSYPANVVMAGNPNSPINNPNNSNNPYDNP